MGRDMGSSQIQALNPIALEYTEALKATLGEALVSVVLFGSVARGEATPLSDIDLLVVVENLPPGRFTRQECLRGPDDAVMARLQNLRSQGVLTDVHALLKTPAEAVLVRPLYLDMVEDAVILYDRDGFFAKVLTDLQAALHRLGARRLRRGRLRYWDLKPDYKPGEVFTL